MLFIGGERASSSSSSTAFVSQAPNFKTSLHSSPSFLFLPFLPSPPYCLYPPPLPSLRLFPPLLTVEAKKSDRQKTDTKQQTIIGALRAEKVLRVRAVSEQLTK